MKLSFKIYLSVGIALLFVTSLNYSCKKKEGSKINSSTPASTEYAKLIKEKTSFVSSIVLDSTAKTNPGMDETYIKLKTKTDENLALYILTVDLNHPNISIEAGMPNNKTIFATQTVKSQITHKNTDLTNKRVIGAVNGDYWNTSTAGEPLGPVIINGQTVKGFPASTYYVMSLLKDGTCVMGDKNTYTSAATNMQNTLGARYLLVKDGVDKSSAASDKDVHPRTTAGIFNSKKVVFMVVDGRRPSLSVGLSLANVSAIYRAIGVQTAVNLDGGGSSTFVARNSNGTYETKNKPSDNADRNVANSWMVISKY